MAEHIVRSFDKDLTELKKTIIRMGELAEAQLAGSFKILSGHGCNLAEEIARSDFKLDSLEHEVDLLTVGLLARRQPLASDLRAIVGALKIATDIERIGDYAVSVARHSQGINLNTRGEISLPILQMVQLLLQMLADTMQAYNLLNVAKAIAVWHRDHKIDEIYTELLTQFRCYMESDSQSVNIFTSLLFVARCLERIGDHIKNVNEHIYFIVEGKAYKCEGT